MQLATFLPNDLAPHLLSVVIFLPLLGALLLLFVRKENAVFIKAAALTFSIVTALVSLFIWIGFDVGSAALQFGELHRWIGGEEGAGLNIWYRLGVDGISLPLLMLTTMLTPFVLACSALWVGKRVKEYCIAMLVLETGMIGSFCAADLFLFYVFFELMLIPMYLLIGVWGGPNRVYAAVKFFLYTLVGSLLMFFAILYLYVGTELFTFSIPELTERLPSFWAEHGAAAKWCFLAFMLSFAIKTPLFPFHTWLPDAHTEAPTGASVILAGVLLKLGTYGMLRFGLGFFPEQAVHFAPLMVTLAVIGIVYGALMALAQEDLKKLVAYSSVSHLGYVVLGIFAFTTVAAQGALLQMINHGLSTGLLFLLVGVIYERRHTRLIEEYGGLAKVMPKFSVIFLIATLASIGLPGLNGFVGELLILNGSFGSISGDGVGFSWDWMRTATLVAGSGIVLGAVYMLWAYQRAVFGKVTRKENQGLKDLSGAELGILVPLVLACFVIGFKPNILLKPMEKSVERLVAPVQAARQRHLAAAPSMAKPSTAAEAGPTRRPR